MNRLESDVRGVKRRLKKSCVTQLEAMVSHQGEVEKAVSV